MSGERVESEGFFEMLWDCDHCGAKGLFAKSQRHCAECGAPQNPDKRYYPPPGVQTRVDGHQYVGADRTCPACSSPMGAAAKNCTQCGSPLDGSREVRGADERTPDPAPRKKRRIWLYVLIAIALIVFAIWFFFIRSHSATLTVAAHRWERSIAIEEYNIHHENAWRDQLPVGAELPVCTRKERTSRKVQDGEDCHTERHDKKDGTFEQVKKCVPRYRSEPVDDDWCSYTIRKWAQVDEVKSSGTGTSPAWPAQNVPPADTPAVFGARRSGPRTEKLVLDFGDAGTCDVADATWRKYSDGQKVKVDVRARSGDIVCSSL